MSNRFDDMIRKQLEKQESAVPDSLFDKIRNHPDVQDALFDGAIRSKILETDSAVPVDAFEKVTAAADLDNLAFDSLITQKIGDLESTVPADMWDRIQQKKDRRRPAIIWWMAAACIGLLGIGSWLWINHQSSTGNEGIALHSTKENNANASSSNDLRIQETTGVGENKKTDTNQEQSSTESLKAKAEKSADDELNKDAKFQSGNTNGKASVSVQTNGSAIGYASNQLDPNSDGVDLNLDPKSDFDAKTLELQNDLSVKHSFSLQELVNKTKLKPGQLLNAKAFKPVLPCPSTGDENRNDWYIDVYSSALLLHKKITDNLGTKNAASGFDSTLHQQVSFNAGINLVKNIGNNFLVKTGFQYNRINEAFRVTRINERRLITTISIRTVILSPGDTVYIKDTSTVEQIGTAKQTHQNTYTQLDIPVILGYEFGGKNIRLNVNAGLIANISSSYKGLVLDTLQMVKDINNVSGKAVYRKNVGLSFYAGVSLVKPITNTLNIFIEPHARIGLSNQASEQMWFRQKNMMTGFSLGIRYKFNSSRQRIY